MDMVVTIKTKRILGIFVQVQTNISVELIVIVGMIN